MYVCVCVRERERERECVCVREMNRCLAQGNGVGAFGTPRVSSHFTDIGALRT